MIFPETATVYPHDVAPSVLEEARSRGEDFVVLPPPRRFRWEPDPAHPLSLVAFGCRRRGHELIPEDEHDASSCWCGAHRYTGLALARTPWLTQPGWQVAVATRTPWRFRLEQAVARIFRR